MPCAAAKKLMMYAALISLNTVNLHGITSAVTLMKLNATELAGPPRNHAVTLQPSTANTKTINALNTAAVMRILTNAVKRQSNVYSKILRAVTKMR